ncbi:GNAT family N-acetyltransferase [Burkholderia sp. L27(2015)]|uniref:GNAT family N-acetyltransferase n=1 Tax=Burkholderia sp. L27(2015) TaxID=1641858 RepID=UPI00131AADD8|nr:GNAT family N-acetyltransferase [Burkholderia sp. L27(2015)]
MNILKDPDLTTSGLARAGAIAAAAAPLVSSSAGGAHSIFHEKWWLDIATEGEWKMARVLRGKEVLGEMPYAIARVGMWRVSHLPPLTRTLGPVIKPLGGSPSQEQCHRLNITTQLIEQLPHFDSFFQVFDPRIEEALSFALQGFSISARYTYRIAPDCPQKEAWARLRGKTRSLIRSADKNLTVAPIDATTEFLNFYEANLAARSIRNAYGSSIMSRLVCEFVHRGVGQLLGAYDRNGKLVAAIGLVWDQHAMYYLLSTRAQGSDSGSISLLLWTALQAALERGLTFDFDGFSSPATFKFLSGFGGTLKQRLGVERLGTVYSVARTLKRRVVTREGASFTPNM